VYLGKKARELKLDLILLELMFLGIHGLDVCRILKADAGTNTIFAIILPL
tara:strand:- start:3675 stop:3824 length:150 start_codon:yes stop_codon:yes gene_type:complete